MTLTCTLPLWLVVAMALCTFVVLMVLIGAAWLWIEGKIFESRMSDEDTFPLSKKEKDESHL